ncbi:DUF4158 domain-containing protein (plasmid) [Ralstonia insidiosa]|nr:DUF4158 domain-containing protein [Ralstonia insidiosa]
MLRYIGEKLAVETPTIASLRTIYQRYPTLYEHQVWALQYLGLTRLDDEQWAGLEAWMRQDAAESLTVEELLQHAHYWLYERRILIPSTRALQDLARSIWAGIERDLLAMIDVVVSREQILRAEAAVFAQHATSGTTVLEWLKTPPARHSPSTMTEMLAKISFLKDLGAHTWTFDAVPIEKQRAYGQRIQARRPAKIRELKASTRTLELVFFLRVTLLELTDAMVYQSGRRISDLVRQAYNKTTTKQAPARRSNTGSNWWRSRPWWTIPAARPRTDWPTSASCLRVCPVGRRQVTPQACAKPLPKTTTDSATS